jgi:hypothetical protein
MMNIKTNLLKNLTAAFVIVFTVGVGGVCAEEFKSKLPKCKGEYSSSWNNCYGKQKFINGSYEGEFKNALYDGNGIFKLDTGEQYIGEFKDMFKHGYGTWTGAIDFASELFANPNFANEKIKVEKYVGKFKNGLREGYGIFIYKNGERYMGDWQRDLRHGRGVHIYEANHSYDGGWYKDKKEGKGIEKIFGSIYVGDFKNNQWDGFGEYTFEDGKYVGEFKNGMMQGKGFELFNDGTITNEGIWDGGQFWKSEKVSFKNFNYKKYLKEKTKIEKEFEEYKNIKDLKICENFEYFDNKEDSFTTNFEKNEIEKSKKLNNCWGKYTDKFLTVYEGEWINGKLNGKAKYVNAKGVKFVGFFKNDKKNGFGKELTSSAIYIGEYISNDRQGMGIEVYDSGVSYIGEWKKDIYNGKGVFYKTDGAIRSEGIFEDGWLKVKSKIDVSNIEKFIKEKEIDNLYAKAKLINLKVTNTQANAEGDFVISIQTGTDTASLKINGEELGGRADGNYTVKKVARAGQETKFVIIAKDTNGNTDSKTIVVVRQVAESSQIKYSELNPALVKTQPSKDAVAIIIGIQNYKRVPKAEFANNDAQAFYDYAIRALGVKPENIKLLVDEQADEVEILSAFQNWLPVKVRKQKTDVYVYYSGHGLPSDDGNSLYILPHGADKQFIAKTAINQQEVIAALQAVQPKSVTMFMDACYSGQIRTGETLIASARPLSIKSNAQSFPAEFTVITASQSDQIASSSADFKHGIFSYYLMKGMEGDADENKDNKITVGEMQNYLQDMVGRKAMSVNRKQVPQLTGDANRVLVGK